MRQQTSLVYLEVLLPFGILQVYVNHVILVESVYGRTPALLDCLTRLEVLHLLGEIRGFVGVRVHVHVR